MKSSSLLIRCFFKQLTKFPIVKYYSKPHTIQSSVGLIFKFPDIKKLQSKQQFDNLITNSNQQIDTAQLLFVQRGGYHLDKNAYNIVFPGGQCDNNETDFQACQRELKQQIGITAQNQCIYLGQLPSNFYYLKKRGKEVHISCHIYCLKSSQQQWTPKLNPQELKAFKWVKISQLFNKDNYKRRNQIKLGVFERMPSFASKIAKQNITNVTMPQLDLGMDRNLWGLTLWIWSYVIQMSLNQAKTKLNGQVKQQIQNLVSFMKAFYLQFKPRSFYKIPASIVASGWHYLYRVKPFTYDPYKKSNSYNIYPALIGLVLLIVLINYYYALFN